MSHLLAGDMSLHSSPMTSWKVFWAAYMPHLSFNLKTTTQKTCVASAANMDMRAGSRKPFGDNKPIKSPTRFHHSILPSSKAGLRSPSDQESKLGRVSSHWSIERTIVRGRSERLSREDQEGCTITRRFPANDLAYSGRRRGSSDANKDFDAVSDSGWGTESEGDDQ